MASGRVRGLAITTLNRSAILPEMPALAETFPGFQVSSWYGCWGPKHLPRDIVSRWNSVIAKTLATPVMRERMTAEGLDAIGGPPERLRERLKDFSAQELSDVFEKNALPYAPITAPQDLLEDPHLKATGGLAPLELNDGRTVNTVLLPLSLNQERLKVRQSAPHLGEHNESLLSSLGYSAEAIQKLSNPS